ncbi:hypothetical protein Nepgr_018581 [Nepenthes gracilis]|uniref:DUF7950 domain-containing protein n=1 Tax=Nepenthes gracilis TaxID=150966 RepID=A0AAD3XUE4_NEPGR|nr:hypothetical protein Nepgr_018581 [Nepenthes gracilis]
MSKYDRIMLRFRPIAPKPVGGCGVPWGVKAENNEGRVRSGRRKTRHTRDGDNNNNKSDRKRDGGSRKRKSCSRKGKLSDAAEAQNNNGMFTLPLLPEMPDLSSVTERYQKPPTWMSFGGDLAVKNDVGRQTRSRSAGPVSFVGKNQTAPRSPQQQRVEPYGVVAASQVIVECVTDTWVDADGGELGRTDEEKRRSLEENTCPGFISDGSNRVRWTNEAYRKMISGGGVVGREELQNLPAENAVVSLVMRHRVPLTCPAFTCRVKVQNTWRSPDPRCSASSPSSLTLPCDVWRMGSGCFAWRLDIAAALCLGR